MFGPSGFFQPFDEEDIQDSSFALEVMNDSEYGFNILYRGNKNGRFFVYKALKPEYRGNVFYEDLLRKDFNIGFSLSHTSICQYYALVNIPQIGNSIVMEWIDGCSLESLIAGGRLRRETAKKLICEICDGLEYIHKKQIIHRDLKPENDLVTYNGLNVKMIDFGLSDSDSYNIYKQSAGTKIYASPELLAGEPVDSRTDIWSLGKMINEMSGYYSHIASKCLVRNRGKRYQSAAEVKKAVLLEGRRRFILASSFFLSVSLVAVTFAGLLSADNIPRQEDRVVIKTDTLAVANDTASSLRVLPKDREVPSKIEDAPVLCPEASGSELLDAASLKDLFDATIKQL